MAGKSELLKICAREQVKQEAGDEEMGTWLSLEAGTLTCSDSPYLFTQETTGEKTQGWRTRDKDGWGHVMRLEAQQSENGPVHYLTGVRRWKLFPLGSEKGKKIVKEKKWGNEES